MSQASEQTPLKLHCFSPVTLVMSVIHASLSGMRACSLWLL